MTAPLSPPPERDVPPAVRERLRARLPAGGGPDPGRRLAPVAAAAALLAVVAGSVLVAERVGRDRSTGPPAGSATTPNPEALAEACAREFTRGPAGEDAASRRLLASFADSTGYLVWIGNDTSETTCTMDRAGRIVSGGGGSRGRMPWVGGARLARGVQVVGWGNDEMTLTIVAGGEPPRLRARDVRGLAAAGVRQVAVSWDGGPAVRAEVKDGFWVARTILPPSTRHRIETRGTITAYDADGRVVGRDVFSG